MTEKDLEVEALEAHWEGLAEDAAVEAMYLGEEI